MTRYTPLWLQNGSYAASVDRRLVGGLWPAGGVTGCAVSPATAMTLNIAAGQVVVPTQNNSGSTLCSSDAVEQVTLAAAPGSGSNRYDLVICQPRGNDLDGGANDDWIFSTVTGTAATTPTVPAVPAGALALARVYVPGGSASVTAGNITDVRLPGLSVPASLHARGWRNGVFNFTTTNTDFVLDTEAFDTGNIFNPATGLFTLPAAGYWTLNAQVGVFATASGQWAQVYWMIGATVACVASAHASSANVFRASATVTVKAAAGDVYKLQIGASATLTGVAGAGGQWNTFATADYLGS
jgi:hypothetical protein